MNEEMNDGFGGEEEFLTRMMTCRNAKSNGMKSAEKRNRLISKSILEKPFCKGMKEDFARAIVSSGGELSEGVRTTIDFAVDNLVISTVEAIVDEKSDEEWQQSLEVSLLTLGKPEIDFPRLRELIESNCKNEIAELKNNRDNSRSPKPMLFGKTDRGNLSPFPFADNHESITDACKPQFLPNVEQSILDILHSFNIKKNVDFIAGAFKAIMSFYENDNNLPEAIREIKGKDSFNAEDYVRLGDMCTFLDKERLAARLYAAGYFALGEAAWRGKALVKLSDLYFDKYTQVSRNREKQWDVMKAVDLLTEALSLGCVKDAKMALEGILQQLFEQYEEVTDVDFIIRNYQSDALCLAAFCLCVGIGWKKDVPSGIRLYESAFARGYVRASYYLSEIQSGRVK